MDRARVDAGMLPLETDLLRTNRFAMVGLAKLAEAVLGKDGVADGFTCLPTVPASLSVNVSDGAVYQLANLEASTWSSLAVDNHNILKQGIILDPTTLTLAPPPTVGYAVNILIQVQYADVDTDLVLRPFYNAANPQQPLAGPNNSNVQTPTTRKGTVQIGAKYGIANTSGTQTSPTVDAGWIGLFVVTLTYGQTQINSGNIVPFALARTAIAKIPTIPSSIQNGTWTSFFDSSGTPNLITGNPLPALQAYQNGTRLSIFLGNTNTGSSVVIRMPNLPDRPLVRQSGQPLLQGDIVANTWITIQDDGTQWRLAGLAQGEVPRFLANPVLYVRTDGNDFNDGSANSPTKAFQTLTAALIFGTSKISYLGTQLQIVMGIPGAYDAPVTGGFTTTTPSLLGAAGAITITTAAILAGDLTKQGLYTVNGALLAASGTSLTLSGFTIQRQGFGHLNCTTSATAYLSYITFAGLPQSTGNAVMVYVPDTGQVRLGSGIKIAVSMPYAFRMIGGGGVTTTAPIAIVGALNFSQAFVDVESTGHFYAAPGSSYDYTNGSATGYRYFAISNGVVDTVGGGANFLPGSIAGSVTTGGQYV